MSESADNAIDDGRVCVFKVQHLGVPLPIEIGEALIMPVPAPGDELWGTEFQQKWLQRWFADENEVTSVIRVPYDVSIGKDDANAKARKLAEDALARLRLALDEARDVHQNQVRFVLDGVKWIPGGTMGWALTGPVAFSLNIVETDPMLERVMANQFLDLPLFPANDVEQRAARAVEWLDRAYKESDEMIQVLHRFSALESILGDQSDGLKAHALAIRRATLAFETDGMFRHPSRLFELYDEVRSYAVHGEKIERPLEADEASKFGWDTREAVAQFIRYAAENGLTKRREVRAALDTSESRSNILTRLVEADPKIWSKYAPSPMTFNEVLTALDGMIGKELGVSYSSGGGTVFSFFNGVLVSGRDATDAEIFERDEDSTELLFSNAVTITLDPARFKHAELTASDNGEILTVTLGRAKISFIAAELT